MKKKVIALALTACMVPVGSGVEVMAAKGDSGDKITLNWQSYDSQGIPIQGALLSRP